MKRLKRYWLYCLCTARLAAAALLVRLAGRKLLRQDLWLIKEKRTEARDNGYHLFRHLRQEYPGINAWYVITRDSADLPKVRELGNVIREGSFTHYLYYTAARFNIGSQPYGAAPHPDDWCFRFRKWCRKDQKLVFLQHGIIKDDLPALHRNLMHYDLFSCAGIPEHRYIMEGLGYPAENAQLIGLCRFDRLLSGTPRKQILVMPTFRLWLTAADKENKATEKECERFRESSFYKSYAALLSDKALLASARKNGYGIVFYLHYSLQSFTDVFMPFGNDTVTIADRRHYDVQALLIESAAMVTDYSSVFFDFAYMEKPEVLYQFDQQEYRAHHYSGGYFDYRRDAFGPVTEGMRETADHLIHLMETGCLMEPEYRERVHQFFAYRDRNNCERTVQAIRRLR